MLEKFRKLIYKTRCHEHNPLRPPKNLPNLALGAPLALFWEGLGGSWTHLGLSWATVWNSCVLLGASWVPLGCLLGAFWGLSQGGRGAV